MKPEDQRIALAQWCGWRLRNASSMMPGTYYHIDKAVNAQPPDYLNDLNAMHEAELKLSGTREDENSQLSQYSENLTFACGYPQDPTDIWYIDLIRATAAQRAEALLRTVGLWKEDE